MLVQCEEAVDQGEIQKIMICNTRLCRCGSVRADEDQWEEVLMIRL